MNEWSDIRLVDLCDRITSGGTPRRGHSEFYSADDDGHPWVKSSELRDGYVSSTQERISDLGLRESSAKLLPPNTVLVAMYGATAGRVGLLKMEAAVNQAVCALVLDPQRADPVFVFHALRVAYRELAEKAAGAAQQNLNAQIIKAFRIPDPGLPTQRRVAAVLSAFDELIEISQRRIELLEDLARSLYREWCVRFRFPGHEDTPLVDSSLGTIPTGWEMARLDSVAKIVMGQSPRSEFYNEVGAGLPFHQGVADYGDLLPNHRKFCTADGRRAGSRDVLCSVRAPVGRLNVADRPLIVGRGLSAIRRHDEKQALLYEQLRASLGEEDSLGGGTIYKAIGKEQLLGLPVLEPPAAIRMEYDSRAGMMLEERIERTLQNRQLAATRDLLLPRLVTGRLDISDVDLRDLVPAEAAA